MAIGIGKKFDFTKNKEAEASPGPERYDVKNSISYKSGKLPK